MSNVYASLDQILKTYDLRTVLELSGDDNRHEGQTNNVQFLLDMQASELESNIGGMYTLPISPVPMVLTKWVLVTTAYRLWQRRTDAPNGLKEDYEWAQEWIKGIRTGALVIPNVSRAVQPTLQDSDFKDGRSRWDWLWGCPSPTGPSKGK